MPANATSHGSPTDAHAISYTYLACLRTRTEISPASGPRAFAAGSNRCRRPIPQPVTAQPRRLLRTWAGLFGNRQCPTRTAFPRFDTGASSAPPCSQPVLSHCTRKHDFLDKTLCPPCLSRHVVIAFDARNQCNGLGTTQYSLCTNAPLVSFIVPHTYEPTALVTPSLVCFSLSSESGRNAHNYVIASRTSDQPWLWLFLAFFYWAKIFMRATCVVAKCHSITVPLKRHEMLNESGRTTSCGSSYSNQTSAIRGH